jgi:predicted  nucleic acid-binding Zn-ribbon protein
MNQAQALYQLQMVDIAIGDHQARLTEIDRLLGDDAVIQAAVQALDSEQAALKPWTTRSNDLDLEIKTLNAKLKTVDERLYSGRVTNPKELQDMQDEIAALKRRRASLEDDLLNAMIEVENHQANCDEAAAHLADLRTQQDAEQADLRRESATLTGELAALEEQRQQALKPISAGTLALYKELRPDKRGQVVAPLIDNMCKACGTTQNLAIVKQVRVGQELVYCTSCGRILVLP